MAELNEQGVTCFDASDLPENERSSYNDCIEFLSHFNDFLHQLSLTPDQVVIHHDMIPRILLRVDKRKEYFMKFHRGTKINEIKQTALMAYWILKFKPFMMHSGDVNLDRKYRRINEGFSAYLLFSAFARHAEVNGSYMKTISRNLRSEFMYALTYWDLSKEAVILIAETMAECLCSVPAQGLPREDSDGNPIP